MRRCRRTRRLALWALVERLAHERVREDEAVELVGLADQARPRSPPRARRATSSSTQRLEQRRGRTGGRRPSATLSTWLALLGELRAGGARSSPSRPRARRSGSARAPPARAAMRSVSSMKNGLPSVSSVRRLHELRASRRRARRSARVSSGGEAGQRRSARTTAGGAGGSSSSPARRARAVPTTSSRIGAASCSRWPSSSAVDVSAQCRSSSDQHDRALAGGEREHAA